MNESDYWIDRANRDSNAIKEEHQSRMNVLVENEEMNKFQMLKPRVYMDGNMFCVAYGPNPMEGVYGYGSTIMQAIYNWNKEFDIPIDLTANVVEKE